MRQAIIALGALSILVACTRPATPPATRIQIQKQLVEVLRPCRVDIPDRPAPLARPLPDDLRRLVAVLGAKLEEYSGEGMFADRALSALRQCTKE
jgi:hypothetical protein